MKKEYMSPDLLVVEFVTKESMLNLGMNSGKENAVGTGSALAPSYDDEEDEEDWEDDAPRRGRRGY